MLARGGRLLRVFSLDSHFTALREKALVNFSLEDLYRTTEACFADTTILTNDPRTILGYRDTIVELNAKFGHHSRQLISGIVRPLLARASVLPDLSFTDSMSLVHLALDMDALADPNLVKSVLKTLLAVIRQREEPLDAQTTLDIYRVMRKTQVLSYELVSELETSQLFQKDTNLFEGGTALLQLYADFNLSLERVRPLVVAAVQNEVTIGPDPLAIAHMKALVSAEEFDVSLWQETILPRMKKLKTHHLGGETMEDLTTVVSALDLLAPQALSKNEFFQSESYLALKSQVLFSAKHSKKLLQFPTAGFEPASSEEKKELFAHADKIKHPNSLTEAIARQLKLQQERFTANSVVSPYSFLAELLLPPDIILKPLTRADYIYDSFQLMGPSRLQLKILRQLKFKVAEIGEDEWAMLPKNTLSGQLTRLIRVARDKKT